MSTTFNCSACQGTIAAAGAPGTQVRCPLCEAVVTVPPPTMPGPMTAARPAGPLRKGMAVGSLICGLAGFITCGLTGLAGIVLGIIALVRANREPNRYGGSGMAVGGICAGALSIMLVPVFLAIMLPSLTRARELSKRLVCGANMRGIGTALKIYAHDWSGADPVFETLVASGELPEKYLLCPSSAAIIGDLHACYRLIKDAHLVAGDYPSIVVMYEDPDNHGGEGGNVLFADGHVEFLRHSDAIEELIAKTQRLIEEAKRKGDAAAGHSQSVAQVCNLCPGHRLETGATLFFASRENSRP